MTAYGAVNSLRNTIDYILNSSHYSFVEPSPHILQLAYEELDPLQEILEKLDSTRTSKSRKKVNSLDERIKELIWEFEDVLESLLYQQILSQVKDEEIVKERAWGFQSLLESLPSQPEPEAEFIFQSPLPHHTTTTRRRTRQVVHKHKGRKFCTPRIMSESEASQSRSLEDDVGSERIRFSIDLQCLQHHVPSFIERLKDMEVEYIYEVHNMPEDDDDGDQSISSRSGIKSKFIGLSDQLEQLANRMDRAYNEFKIFTLVGTAGIGKTALAEAVFNRLTSNDNYEHRVWVTVGRRSQSDDVFRDILRQMFGIKHVDDDLGAYLKERLKGKKTLIVLDDVWERQILDSLVSSLGSIRSGYIHILVTTRDKNTIPSRWELWSTMLLRFLNEEESKELLCEKVFGEKDCPFQLDKAATKIAKKCEGLPLMIVTVADILSKSQNIDPKYWDDVAEMRNSVFMDAYNEISKVLFPSYNYLPQYLKMPFLYMGVFPPDYDIPKSKLINMLATECWFHNTKKEQSLVNSVSQCLDELCDNKNLALSKKRIWEFLGAKIKTCRLHSSWRYVCRGVVFIMS